MRLQLHAAAFALAIIVSSTCWGGEIVYFEDGRSMRVEAVERQPTGFLLSLEGGSELSIPAARVLRWESEAPAVAESVPANAAVYADAPWRAAAGEFAELIDQAADRHRLDPALLTALARVESALDPQAVSPKGAQGLLQLMPATARRFGVRDSFDVAQNVNAGAEYLSWLLDRFAGRLDLALAGYNAGEGAVDRYDGVPPFRETRAYVVKVLDRMDRLNGASH